MTRGRPKTTIRHSLKLVRLREIIKLLREKSYSNEELIAYVQKSESEIPGRSVRRYIEDLVYLGLIKQREGRWVWQPYIRVYKTKDDLEIALNHSKDLIPALDSILAEDKLGWLPQESEWAAKVESEGNELKQYAERHLRVCYPNVYDKVEDHRKLCREIELLLKKKGYSKAVIDFIIDGVETIPEPEEFKNYPNQLPKNLKDLIERKLQSYHRLASSIDFLKKKIAMGEPLDGHCPLCPNVHILARAKM